jgi:general nucleoside transport system permease protein
MSLVLTPGQTVEPTPPARVSRPAQRVWLWIGLVLFALATTRVLTGADDIGSAGTMRAALVAAVPIALAGLGGLWSERAGVINIGLEGMMILGTLGAGYYGYHWGVWAGLLGAALFGLIGGVLHAVATVVFGVDHIVSGVAINIIAAGIARFLAEAWFSDLEGGGPTQSPSIDSPPTITVPGLSDWSADLADKEWYLVSDAAALVNALVEDMSVFTLLALALIAGTGWLLWKTAFGLLLRSCGEAPVAAETLGVNVYRYKFIAVTMSGVFAGLGGAYLAMVASSGYQNDMTNGRGYIGLAAMIFGNWRPGGLLAGSLLFGYTDAARLRSGGESIHALMLILAVALIALAIWQWRRQQKVMAAVTAGIGVVSGLVFALTDEIPGDFTEMSPYIATMLVLALASQRLRVPAADGKRYRRGEAT